MQYALKDEDKSDIALVRKVNAQLLYYTNLNPYELSVEQWAMAWNDLVWIRSQEANKKNPK